MFKKLLILTLSISLLLTGCNIKKKENKEEKNTSTSIYEYLKLEFDNENIIYSPLSIETAFSMLNEGAQGETKEELNKLFSNVKINKYENTENLSLANTLFINNNYKSNIKSGYIEKLKEKYNAEINYDDFENPDNINNWVNKNTLGLINKIIDNLNPSMVGILINALAIDIGWMKPFETYSTSGKEFTLIDGSSYLATTMYNTYENYASYYIDDNITAVSLDLKKEGNSELEFVAIMPNDITKYVENINEEEVNKILNNLTKISSREKVNGNTVKLRLSIPRFKYDYSLKLKEDLQNLGIEKSFTSDADFSGIAKDLYISDVLHKANIDFTEKGIKAAAVTALVLETSSMKPISEYIDIDINKPFMYVIRDKKTNDIWFIGVVVKPNSWSDDENWYKQQYEMEY